MRLFILLFLGGVMLCGCGERCSNELAELAPTIEIERLENELFSSESPEDVRRFLAKNPTMTTEFLGSAQYPNDSVLSEVLFDRVKNEHIQGLLSEAQNRFGNMDDLASEIGEAIGALRHYYPDAKIPRVQTMLTGFGTSEMYVSDSLIIIGLDYYIGKEASYRPNQYPAYILKRYEKEYLVPAMMLLLSDNYLHTDLSDQRMIADMVFYGKKFYFTKSVMPCAPDSLIIWYSEKELSDVEENKDIIWANFVHNELLFETSHITKEKFLGERPNTYEISAICPGRIGAWVGWEIVRSFMERNPDVTLPQLMANPDAMEIFNASNYKG